MGIEQQIEIDRGADPVDRLAAERKPGYGLGRAFYVDPLVYERDLERLIRRHWHCAGHASRIAAPGDFFRVDIDVESVIVARDKAGDIHAFLNVCRHRGAEVCTKREGNAKAFVCPYHAWTYRLDGTLQAAR